MGAFGFHLCFAIRDNRGAGINNFCIFHINLDVKIVFLGETGRYAASFTQKRK